MATAVREESRAATGVPDSGAGATALECDRLRRRLIESIAERCAALGYRRIALFGAGRHTAAIIRQPWAWFGISIVAVLDDRPRVDSLGGVRVVRPEELCEPVDAVIVSSDAHEQVLYERAMTVFGPRVVPVFRIYAGVASTRENPEASVSRLVLRSGLTESDARWLVENRDERHDATLPMLPAERTEMHLRRYELAAMHARGKQVLDIACGTGYGSRLLLDQGMAASVLGADIDQRAVDYARRRFGVGENGSGARVRFECAGATDTGLDAASIGLVTSFETIEHVPDAGAVLAEFRRVLIPGGTLVMSTPNDTGPTAHHAHSFTREAFSELLEAYFPDAEWVCQRAGDEPRRWDMPAGMEPLTPGVPRPDNFIVIARASR